MLAVYFEDNNEWELRIHWNQAFKKKVHTFKTQKVKWLHSSYGCRLSAYSLIQQIVPDAQHAGLQNTNIINLSPGEDIGEGER